MSIENIADISPRIQYIASASQTVFPYPFPIFDAADIAVYDESTLQVLTTHYTVGGVGNDLGGDITFLTGRTAGNVITIYRDTSIARTSDFQQNGPLGSSSVNDELDRRVIVEQELKSAIARTVKLSPLDTSTDDDLELPVAADRANKYFAFDVNGEPSMASGTGADAALRDDLADPTGAGLGSNLVATQKTQAEINALVTVVNYQHEPYDINRYGADPSASAATNTTAIRNCILAATVNGDPITASLAGIYTVTAATAIALEGGTEYTAFTIYSKLHIDLPGVTFKMADNVSTDAAPLAINMFATNAVLTNVSFRRLVMDMNGANNLISPNRGSGVYDVTKNMAHISVSGTPAGNAARITDCVIEGCVLKNTSGVCCVVAGQSNSVGITLGERWTIKNNLFIDNGLDTEDHTSVFGWTDDMIGEGNTFVTADALKTTVLGGVSAWEIHGANHRLVNNLVVNYYLGFRVAQNYTSDVTGSTIENNVFYPRFYGVTFFTESANDFENTGTRIHNNVFIFDDTDIAAAPDQKACVQISTTYAVSDISIRGNLAYGTDDVVGTTFLEINKVGAVAAQTYGSIVVAGNYAKGLTFGAYVTTNATNGISYLEFTDNTWVDLSAVTGVYDIPIGIRIGGNTAALGVLKIEGNTCVDTRGTAQCDYGIYLYQGTITTLIRGENYASGMVTANYIEDAVTITNRRGVYSLSTVASATALVVPIGVRTIFVSGTTNITSITAAGHEGEEVTLVFQDVLTFTDGSNLRLAGNFVTTADDTITLWCDGTNWYEKGRSAN